MKSTATVLAGLALALGLCVATASASPFEPAWDQQRVAAQVEYLVRMQFVTGLAGLSREEESSSGRHLLQTTYSANEYTKCIYDDGCSLNPLFFATNDFGAKPENALQNLMMGYAYQSKQCASKNNDNSGCTGLNYCTYRSSGLCQYQGAFVNDDTVVPGCSDAKISWDDVSKYSSCKARTTESSCTSFGNSCSWSGSACNYNGGNAAQVEAFVNYYQKGQGEWKDEWFGTCASGKLAKTIYTTCHGTDGGKCNTDKCIFFSFSFMGTSMSYCMYKADALIEETYGNNDFTKNWLRYEAECAAKSSGQTTCEDTKGPAPTVDLSKYSDLAKLQADARDKGAASTATASLVTMALSALMAAALLVAAL